MLARRRRNDGGRQWFRRQQGGATSGAHGLSQERNVRQRSTSAPTSPPRADTIVRDSGLARAKTAHRQGRARAKLARPPAPRLRKSTPKKPQAVESFHDGSPPVHTVLDANSPVGGWSSTALVQSRDFGSEIDARWNTACCGFAEPMNDGFATTGPSLSAAWGDLR